MLIRLDDHKTRTGIPKQVTADVGIYLATQLTSDSFQKCLNKLSSTQPLESKDITLMGKHI